MFEAAKKAPSGIGKVKDHSTEEDVEFIAGDVYDLSGDNRYTEKFKYYKGDGNGFIMDKDGNYYDVVTSTWSSDSGRIAGGTMNYSVVIKNVKGINLSFSGWYGVFSSPHYANIVSDIENGMYLEDFLAKNWGALNYDTQENDEIKKLKDKGDAKAKTYKAEKAENAAQKKLEFFERYLVLPDNISFSIKEDKIEFQYWNPTKRKKEDEPKQSQYSLRRSDFETEEAYNDAVENARKQWEEYSNKYKELDNKIFDIFRPFCEKKLKEFFKTDIKNLNGLSCGVKPKDKSFRDKTALDTKDKKLVVLHDYNKQITALDGKWKVNKDAVAEIEFYPTAKINKEKASEYLVDLFKRASEAYVKLNGRQKGKYIDAHWEEYYSWYGSNGKTSVKGEAKHRAEIAFLDDIKKHNWDNTTAKEISFDIEFLKDYVNGEIPQTAEEKEETSKQTTKEEIKTDVSKARKVQEPKMDAWHNGTRKQNVEACSDAKLKLNYEICKDKGYDKEAAILKKEADARGLTLESLNLEEMKFSIIEQLYLN